MTPKIDHSFYRRCRLCPWMCGVDRTGGERGKCDAPARLQVSDYMPHFGEEACLTGEGGSGAVFFSYCTLRCLFCQTHEISTGRDGSRIDTARLVSCFLELEKEGCENLNLISPTHFLPHIVEALHWARQQGLSLRVVYNTSAFERVSVLERLEGLVDVYLPDFKYWQPQTAEELCGARHYPSAARRAILEMHRQTGDLQLDSEGRAVRGVLLRHLILPGYFEETRRILEWTAQELSVHTYVNLMGHFRPCHRARENPRLSRPLSEDEYETLYQWALKQGLHRLDQTHRKLYPLIWRKKQESCE